MVCEPIPSVSYSEFSQRIFEAAGTKRIPINVTYDLTRKCNLQCVHCYLPREGTGAELTTEEVQRLLGECADAGALWFLFSGGEPLLRPDFTESYLYAKRLGLFMCVFTNATLVTEEIADLFAEWPPYVVEVTVHSMKESVFEAVTRVPGSFRRCLSGIELLLDRKIPLRLKTVVMRQNKTEFHGVRRFADSVGVSWRYDNQVQPRVDRGLSPLDHRLSPREAIELELRDPDRIAAWEELTQREADHPAGRVFGCGAGIRTCHVTAEGGISACTLSQYATYDWRQGTVREAWDEFIPRFISRKTRAECKCEACELMFVCGRCAAWSFLEEGDEQRPLPYLCELGSLRKRAAEARGELERELAVPFGPGGR